VSIIPYLLRLQHGIDVVAFARCAAAFRSSVVARWTPIVAARLLIRSTIGAGYSLTARQLLHVDGVTRCSTPTSVGRFM